MKLLKRFSPLDCITVTVCVLLLISFIITILNGIVNHGNIIGSIVCLVVILNTLIYRTYIKIKPVRIISGSLHLLTIIIAIYSAVLSALMIWGMTKTPEKAESEAIPVMSQSGTEYTETVIVLGCRTINGAPSYMLQARLDKAIEYLEENPSAVCIVSGGQGDDEIEAESETMYKYLITKGIDKERIYKENKSRNTEQNILFSESIIREQNLPKKVIVVSEVYHVYRGIRNAEKLGLNAYSQSAVSRITWWAYPSYWIRELFAISKDVTYDLLGI